MTTKPSTIGQWVGAAIATVVIIGASFLGFHAFNARAQTNAELQSGTQSPQSDSTVQSGSQSGDTPQSAEPTPAEITKPTPPTHLYAGGQIGAQATSQWYIDLWAYAFNTGDTEDFMKVCQNDDYCTRVNNDVQALHADRIVTRPITFKYLMTKKIWDCTSTPDHISGTCITFNYSELSGTAIRKDNDATKPDYSTISFSSKSDEAVDHYEGTMLLVAEGDTWVVKHFWTHKE
ncbi:DUF6318 family protein [Actinomyces sp. oral taxon 180]|uniref:DUF6318 family protein n=1 Tax=Actinomyces sp. oral taxon 180 TaxID=651609 RepID=UPI0001F0FC63|nr:DUF6318 family protein [Actinomyces sp. oral taxon 180]EFU60879.1 conserved hypothetical protein [Actinomyces sp. oral taxon 180 str. F0310]